MSLLSSQSRVRPRSASATACALLLAALLAGAADGQAPAGGAPQSPPSISKFGAKVTQLQIVDEKPGTGAEAVSGKAAIVHYTGWLYDPKAPDGHGAKFDSSRDRGVPFGFIVGVGKVIKGWDEGVAGMKVGEKRKLTIPANLAYGDNSPAPSIPPGSILIFDVELVAIVPGR